MTEALRVTGLHAAYGRVAVLEDVSVSVAVGGVTALLGANGAGKTTLLRAVSNVLVAARGEIVLEGENIAGLPPAAIARRGVAHVPEGRGTLQQLTVEENLRVGGMARPPGEVRADIERLYGLFPRLAEYRGKTAGLLSGGEQQMLAISRALVSRPRLLMLDEPSFGLAPLVVRQIFELLARIRAESSLAILLVEQNAKLALEFADRACVLENGRVALAGSAAELRADPRVRAIYLGGEVAA